MIEDESGDSEDGEDELPCVIRGEREGDSIWRGIDFLHDKINPLWDEKHDLPG